MYFSKPGLIIGFHGCEESIRDDIISGKASMRPSENAHDWLGKGYYFWENNYDRAMDFALNPPGKKKYDKPAVLGAVIDLQFCLYLLETEYLNWVKYAFENLKMITETSNLKLPVNLKGKASNDLLIRNLDCSVIERLHFLRQASGLQPHDSARDVFVEGNELYPGAGFHEKNHIQICIRNPNCIKGFFLPRKEVKWP